MAGQVKPASRHPSKWRTHEIKATYATESKVEAQAFNAALFFANPNLRSKIIEICLNRWSQENQAANPDEDNGYRAMQPNPLTEQFDNGTLTINRNDNYEIGKSLETAFRDTFKETFEKDAKACPRRVDCDIIYPGGEKFTVKDGWDADGKMPLADFKRMVLENLGFGNPK